MRVSAGCVCDFLQICMDHLLTVRTRTIISIARAVWTQSVPLAETLLVRAGLAREMLRPTGDKILLIDYKRFAEMSDRRCQHSIS